MYQNVNRYVDFLAKHRITQNQFLFLYLIKFNEYGAIKVYKEAFPTGDRTMIGEAQKEDLIKLGFIEKVGEGSTVTDYRITEKFNNLYLQDKFAAADEVWALYPGYARIGNSDKAVPLTNMDKYQFAIMYSERIKHSIDEHLEVIEDLKYARNNGLINYGIRKFVESEQWRKIRPLRKKEDEVIRVDKLMEDF